MRVSVPGNLLLAGEYLVTREGGRGIALAVEPRVEASAEPSGSWSVSASMGSERALWTPGSEVELPLASAILDAAAQLLAAEGLSLATGLSMRVDSGAFFRPDGGKSGFGSSAASAVAMALLVCRASGVPDDRMRAIALGIALRAHRAMQGGRGSGYDVFASMHGGLGLFTGGASPSWRPLDPGCLPDASILFGFQSVRSGPAVQAFDVALSRQPREMAAAMDRMAAAVDGLADVCSLRPNHEIPAARENHARLCSLIADARDAGIAIGELIGVSARMDCSPPGCLVKALGAGNEIALLVRGELSPGAVGPASDAAVLLPLAPSVGPRWN